MHKFSVSKDMKKLTMVKKRKEVTVGKVGRIYVEH